MNVRLSYVTLQDNPLVIREVELVDEWNSTTVPPEREYVTETYKRTKSGSRLLFAISTSIEPNIVSHLQHNTVFKRLVCSKTQQTWWLLHDESTRERGIHNPLWNKIGEICFELGQIRCRIVNTYNDFSKAEQDELIASFLGLFEELIRKDGSAVSYKAAKNKDSSFFSELAKRSSRLLNALQKCTNNLSTKLGQTLGSGPAHLIEPTSETISQIIKTGDTNALWGKTLVHSYNTEENRYLLKVINSLKKRLKSSTEYLRLLIHQLNNDICENRRQIRQLEYELVHGVQVSQSAIEEELKQLRRKLEFFENRQARIEDSWQTIPPSARQYQQADLSVYIKNIGRWKKQEGYSLCTVDVTTSNGQLHRRASWILPDAVVDTTHFGKGKTFALRVSFSMEPTNNPSFTPYRIHWIWSIASQHYDFQLTQILETIEELEEQLQFAENGFVSLDLGEREKSEHSRAIVSLEAQILRLKEKKDSYQNLERLLYSEKELCSSLGDFLEGNDVSEPLGQVRTVVLNTHPDYALVSEEASHFMELWDEELLEYFDKFSNRLFGVNNLHTRCSSFWWSGREHNPSLI